MAPIGAVRSSRAPQADPPLNTAPCHAPRSAAGPRWGKWGESSSSWPAGTPACHLRAWRGRERGRLAARGLRRAPPMPALHGCAPRAPRGLTGRPQDPLLVALGGIAVPPAVSQALHHSGLVCRLPCSHLLVLAARDSPRGRGGRERAPWAPGSAHGAACCPCCRPSTAQFLAPGRIGACRPPFNRPVGQARPDAQPARQRGAPGRPPRRGAARRRASSTRVRHASRETQACQTVRQAGSSCTSTQSRAAGCASALGVAAHLQRCACGGARPQRALPPTCSWCRIAVAFFGMATCTAMVHSGCQHPAPECTQIERQSARARS